MPQFSTNSYGKTNGRGNAEESDGTNAEHQSQQTPLRSKSSESSTRVSSFDSPSPPRMSSLVVPPHNQESSPNSLFISRNTPSPYFLRPSRAEPRAPPILSQTTTQQPSVQVPIISPSIMYNNSPVTFNFSRQMLLQYLQEQKVDTDRLSFNIRPRGKDLFTDVALSPASPATTLIEQQLRTKSTDYNSFYRDLFREKVTSPIRKSFVYVPHSHGAGKERTDEHHDDSSNGRTIVTQSTYIKIQIVTWNMQGKSAPPRESIAKFASHVDSQHIFVFGAQECERSIASSFLFRSKQNWETVLQELVGENYEIVASSTLVATHCIVFVHKELKDYISDIATSEVATGFLNGSMGNKGCASVSFRVANDSFMFICSHLAAHQQNVEQRNAHYHRIMSEVDYKIRSRDTSFTSNRSSTPSSAGSGMKAPKNGIFNDFDYVFFFGDLNYRVNGTRKEVDRRLSLNDTEGLLQNDQLLRSKDVGLAFQELQEGKILFPPTYKFCKINPDQYDSSKKQRIPSWTDRILFYNRNHHHHNLDKDDDEWEKPGGTPSLKLLEYDSVDNVKYSDHRPVLGRFLCKIAERDERDESERRLTRSSSSVCSIQ
mmetsp:Transcript_8787/g.32515  ORF Transcript_8787/g.32515 Transcript_8787/m.32515 type:complete len:599 (-) Transcript_8787:99-1895(-)